VATWAQSVMSPFPLAAQPTAKAGATNRVSSSWLPQLLRNTWPHRICTCAPLRTCTRAMGLFLLAVGRGWDGCPRPSVLPAQGSVSCHAILTDDRGAVSWSMDTDWRCWPDIRAPSLVCFEYRRRLSRSHPLSGGISLPLLLPAVPPQEQSASAGSGEQDTSALTTTQARLARGARAELESQLPGPRARAGKCAMIEAWTGQGERKSRLVALSPYTRVDLLGPQLERSRAGGGQLWKSPWAAISLPLTSTHFHLLRVAGGGTAIGHGG